MRFLAAVVLCGLWVASPSDARAGDPCPIDFAVYDFGTPSWLDRDKTLAALSSRSYWTGVSIYEYEGEPRIYFVYDGTPAKAAGVFIGDRILSVAGVPVRDTDGAFAAFDTVDHQREFDLVVRRGDETKTLKLHRVLRDPFVTALAQADHGGWDCVTVDKKVPPSVDAAAFKTAVFGKGRRFQCKTAHKALRKVIPDAHQHDGQVVVVRGRRRILISLVGRTTRCVAASDYDGSLLTEQRLVSLFFEIAESLVAYRHAHP